MSTITVTNIKATGETASRPSTGVAAALCAFNQNAITRFGMAQDAQSVQNFNISSYANDSNGEATIGLTNAMANASLNFQAGIGATNNTLTIEYSASTSSSLKLEANDADSNVTILQACFMAIFGDLA